LNFKKIEPFKIEEQIEKVNYKLRLSENIQIYSVFHIFLLESAPTHAIVIIKPEEILPENSDTD